MSIEENKAVVRRWFEAFNPQNPARVLEDCAPDFVFHGTGAFGDMDLASVKQLTTAFLTAFPDAHYTLEDLIAEGDKVHTAIPSVPHNRGSSWAFPLRGSKSVTQGLA